MRMLIASIAVVGVLITSCVSSLPSSVEKKGEFSVAFYNVENLFDTIDDPHRNDNEFLPHSAKEWTAEKYQHKLLNISRAILAINDWNGPDVLGLCEVENRSVLQDLINNTALKGKGLGIIHRNSPDPRGIDVALLYNKNKADLISYEYIPILKNGSVVRTREMLLVSLLYKKDTLHFFVNHWSSRRGGQKQSEHKRIQAAIQLKAKVDSLLLMNEAAKIMIMGDFNDDPEDESIQTLIEDQLVNVTQRPTGDVGGTLKYRGKWNIFDQMIVSKGVLQDCEKRCLVEGSFHVWAPEWMLTPDERYSGKEPLRTYKGKNYLAGYSDHFPVIIKISK